MSTQRKLRKEKQMAQTNPINVTVIEAGQKKVIPYKEYKEKYLQAEEAEAPDE